MKTVLKWNLYLDCELSAQESWLEELSREGLSVRCRFGPLALCDRGDPHPARRFRIEPARTWASASDPPARALTDLYQEAGWTYLRRLPNELGELFYTDDPGPRSPIPTRRPRPWLWRGCGGTSGAVCGKIWSSTFSRGCTSLSCSPSSPLEYALPSPPLCCASIWPLWRWSCSWSWRSGGGRGAPAAGWRRARPLPCLLPAGWAF